MRFNKQKMLSGVLATGLALSCMVGPAYATRNIKDLVNQTATEIEQQEKAMANFKDIPANAWYYDYVAKVGS